MRLSELRRILEKGEIRLTKSLGQNFLHDANQLERIAEAARLSPADRILEIGPGLGPLTEQLVAVAQEVLGIEKDRRLYEWLKQRMAATSNLRLLHEDALDYLRQEEHDWTGWKMVSNLPYSVASPILVDLSQAMHPPSLMVATLQWEVAQRLSAGPGDKDYGILTLLVQQRYRPAGQFKISAGCFFPEPEVDSACIVLESRPAALLAPEEKKLFVRLVKQSFSQRRKMMFKLLKAVWPASALEEAFGQTGLQTQVRAETVSLEQFVKLTHILHKATPGNEAGKVGQ